MEAPELLLAIAEHFSPVEDGDMAKLKHEIRQDWKDVIIDEKHEGYKGGWKATLKKHTQDPWIRLGLSLLYIPSIRWISDWMHPKEDDEDDEGKKIVYKS